MTQDEKDKTWAEWFTKHRDLAVDIWTKPDFVFPELNGFRKAYREGFLLGFFIGLAVMLGAVILLIKLG